MAIIKLNNIIFEYEVSLDDTSLGLGYHGFRHVIWRSDQHLMTYYYTHGIYLTVKDQEALYLLHLSREADE